MRQNHSQLMEQYAREISKMRAQENARVDKKAQEANAIENYNRLAAAADSLQVPKQLQELEKRVKVD